ncbi:C-type lectin protein [Fusarium flagelliforme]|uniref:C-type lectin protein n=1 Tax=Fusarium flagelliforme TaxID=2675880 RepID=UPI001E8E3E08|nr:C-type lectin protein [Fusarium flagelliforme]KAH7179815.1 C-type lectin protein [Fusarium flagelliforme]
MAIGSLTSKSYAFPLKPKDYAAKPLPSLKEWEDLWAAWHLVTTKMIPADALMEQPIPLRNPLLFYLGHIPAFEDIHLTRAINGKPVEPAVYHDYFGRGIDPDVNDPTQCHDHSELPKTWPSLQNILDYRHRVNQRIIGLYDDPKTFGNRTIERALWIGFEHEALHLETFLYMTLQSPNIKPPPGPAPDFAAMAKKAHLERVENQWFQIPAQEFTIGFDDPESDDGPDRFFAWDNEREPYSVTMPEFEAQARPVCNEEYATYLVSTGKTEVIPVTWTKLSESDANGQFINTHAIKTVYGPIPLTLALDWPLMSSYQEAEAYAEWVGARIPTLHEVRSIHEYVEKQKKATLGHQDIEVEDKRLDPEEIFVDLTGCNTGLQNFHPTPVTQNGGRLSGLGDMGGAWEWSSSWFAPQPNFKPMDIYPGYSADFMKGKHKAITGGSWAVHPRISGRKSFLNWWQVDYPYPWVTPRLVRDINKN